MIEQVAASIAGFITSPYAISQTKTVRVRIKFISQTKFKHIAWMASNKSVSHPEALLDKCLFTKSDSYLDALVI